MSKRKVTAAKPMTGNDLGKKLLQSVKEMKAGKIARVTEVSMNEVVDRRALLSI